jgi:hypothetical protein
VKRALVHIGQMALVRPDWFGVHRSQPELPRFPAINRSVGAFSLYDNRVVTSSRQTGDWHRPWQTSLPELRQRQAEAACQRPYRGRRWR